MRKRFRTDLLAGTAEDRGATAIMVAVGLTLLLGILAMGLDGARLYGERRVAHNAADHAALTASWTECTGGSEAAAVAAGLASAASNGFNNDGVTNTVTVARLGNRRYEATIDTEINATFGRMLGASQLDTGAEAVAYCETGGGGEYALFASGSACTGVNQIEWTANDLTVEGKVHSNDEIYVNANNPSVDGETTHSGTYTFNGAPNPPDLDPPPFSAAQQTYPTLWDITDYDPPPVPNDGSIAWDADALGQYYSGTGIPGYSGSGNWDIPDGYIFQPGIYYVEGNVKFGGNLGIAAPGLPGQHPGVTVVSKDGKVEFTGNNVNLSFWEHPDNEGLLILTTKPEPPAISPSCTEQAVTISGNNTQLEGIIFAPNGVISANGQVGSSVGALWGYQLTLTGEGYSVSFPQLPITSEPLVELYE